VNQAPGHNATAPWRHAHSHFPDHFLTETLKPNPFNITKVGTDVAYLSDGSVRRRAFARFIF
jgi:hypothetical protein